MEVPIWRMPQAHSLNATPIAHRITRKLVARSRRTNQINRVTMALADPIHGRYAVSVGEALFGELLCIV